MHGALVGAGQVDPAEDEGDEDGHEHLLEEPDPVHVQVPEGVDPGPLKRGRKFGQKVRIGRFFRLTRLELLVPVKRQHVFVVLACH